MKTKIEGISVEPAKRGRWKVSATIAKEVDSVEESQSALDHLLETLLRALRDDTDRYTVRRSRTTRDGGRLSQDPPGDD